jgi:hypothetical protein
MFDFSQKGSSPSPVRKFSGLFPPYPGPSLLAWGTDNVDEEEERMRNTMSELTYKTQGAGANLTCSRFFGDG